jgi:hypothetical protein
MSNLLRLVTFEHSGSRRIGSLHNGDVFDLTTALGIRDMKSFLEGGEKNMKLASDVVNSAKHKLPAKDVRLRAPM